MCLSSGRETQKDGEKNRKKKQGKGKKKRSKAQDKWTHASQKTPFLVKIEVHVCVRRRLMDGLVYTARGVQRGVWGEGGCMILGGARMEWCDRFDWAHVPWRERCRWMDRNRAVAEEALTDRSGEKACRKSMDGWRGDGQITAEVDAESFLRERRGQAASTERYTQSYSVQPRPFLKRRQHR